MTNWGLFLLNFCPFAEQVCAAFVQLIEVRSAVLEVGNLLSSLQVERLIMLCSLKIT